jgi:uncharacterized protein YlaI
MKCPECGKGIDYLVCIAKEYVEYTYNGEFEQTDILDTEEMEFECPECHKIVAKDTKEADKILGIKR